jgi:hypothetical protein
MSEKLQLAGQGALAPDAVDRPVARRPQQPPHGVERLALAGPELGGHREGIGGRLLGQIDVAEVADQGRDQPAPVLAKSVLDQPGRPITGRISTAPPS